MKIAALFSLLAIFAASTAEKPVTFSGTVTHGQAFSKKLPDGLIFELTPEGCGWTIDVHPQVLDDASYISGNAPLHGKNALNLDDSYDGDWESPLKTAHTVYFATDHRQAKQRGQKQLSATSCAK